MTSPSEKDVALRAAYQQIANMMSSGLEEFIQQQAVMARYSKVRYDAFVKAGFTPDQAIQLCK